MPPRQLQSPSRGVKRRLRSKTPPSQPPQPAYSPPLTRRRAAARLAALEAEAAPRERWNAMDRAEGQAVEAWQGGLEPQEQLVGLPPELRDHLRDSGTKAKRSYRSASLLKVDDARVKVRANPKCPGGEWKDEEAATARAGAAAPAAGSALSTFLADPGAPPAAAPEQGADAGGSSRRRSASRRGPQAPRRAAAPPTPAIGRARGRVASEGPTTAASAPVSAIVAFAPGVATSSHGCSDIVPVDADGPARPKTNFERVLDFSRAFNIKVPAAPRAEIFHDNPQQAQHDVQLLLSEVQEVQAGTEHKSIRKVTEALANLVYAAYSTGASLGVDMDAAVQAVHSSNMSLLCESEESARQALQWHQESAAGGCDGELDVKLAGDGEHWLVYRKQTGDVLRSLDWRPTDLVPLGV